MIYHSSSYTGSLGSQEIPPSPPQNYTGWFISRVRHEERSSQQQWSGSDNEWAARPWNCDSGAEGGEDIRAGQQAPASHCSALCVRHHWDKAQDQAHRWWQSVSLRLECGLQLCRPRTPSMHTCPLIQLYHPVGISEPSIMSKESEEEQVQGVKFYFAPEHPLDSKGA